MQFNDKFISIPPYISTTWNNVKSLRMVGTALQVNMSDSSYVMVRDLEMDVIEDVFAAHARYLDRQLGGNEAIKAKNDEKPTSSVESSFGSSLLGENPGMVFPFHIGMGEKEVFGGALQHNLEYANAPDLPQDVITKIASIAKIVAPEGSAELPQPEPHCNCPHCQIARAIHLGLGNPVKPFSGSCFNADETQSEQEEVNADDLKFQQWQIEQVGENLFQVINKLDATEQYRVFLGSPVGCTCGKSGCEHIIAVLES